MSRASTGEALSAYERQPSGPRITRIVERALPSLGPGTHKGQLAGPASPDLTTSAPAASTTVNLWAGRQGAAASYGHKTGGAAGRAGCDESTLDGPGEKCESVNHRSAPRLLRQHTARRRRDAPS